ncbi:MAG TPA: porin family protein [Hymenobacter sp.]|uniref:porin family protein n=1 Tax=Hymenobacter sp. TaxID=1898978 RepID=UPI002EDB59A1
MLAVLVACASTARAQEAAPSSDDNHFGIKAGASLSNFVGKDVQNSDNLFGFHAGFVANVALGERFSIQPELLYSIKGAKTEVSAGTTTFQRTQSLHYVELPILVKAKFSQFFVEAGPQAGVLVRAKSKTEGGSMEGSISNKDEYGDVDFGYVAGLGYQLESGPMVGLRYNGGLSNVDASEVVSGRSIQTKARNNVFQLYVGYTFGN